MPQAASAEEAPFVPRARWHVRLRRARRRLAEEWPRLVATLVLVVVVAWSVGRCVETIRGTPIAGEVGARPADPVDSGGEAVLWFLLAAGAAGLLPRAMAWDPERRALLKPGALSRELKAAWAALRARRARRARP